jgi:hypothetical protein
MARGKVKRHVCNAGRVVCDALEYSIPVDRDILRYARLGRSYLAWEGLLRMISCSAVELRTQKK